MGNITEHSNLVLLDIKLIQAVGYIESLVSGAIVQWYMHPLVAQLIRDQFPLVSHYDFIMKMFLIPI